MSGLHLLACSGPGDSVQRLMAAADRIGAIWWAITFGVFAVGFFLRDHLSRQSLAATALCFLLHPSWWMSVSSGDCGYTKEQYSPVFGFLAMGCLAVGLMQHRATTRRP